MLQHTANHAENSGIRYFCLAFVAMAGLAYLNFLPAVVDALAGRIGFSAQQAGTLVASNGYGALVGSICAIFVVRHIAWKPALLFTFIALGAMELSTSAWSTYTGLLTWRFIAGVLGGFSVGISFAILARLTNPDRAFGTLLFIQFSIGSVVIYAVPALERLLGGYAVFYIMAALVFIALFFLPLLPALPAAQSPKQHSKRLRLTAKSTRLLLAMLLYLVAASGIWAFAGQIGQRAGLPQPQISQIIALTGLLGLAGALLPIMRPGRTHRTLYLCGSILLCVMAALLLIYAHFDLVYMLALALLFFAWPAVHAYLLALIAEQDSSGQLSSVAAVVSSIGVASGPLLGAALLSSDTFTTMLCTIAVLFVFCLLLLQRPLKSPAQRLSQLSTTANHKYQTTRSLR
ncbi:MFS transporter [Pseudoalteromonas sp. OOF1S-7]|uniref:MFS transporter n=1 Tax=Pseudoalteromonas sp. OOF1S-7 TaxID=2917757 RepID=UPI001EF4A850|nr:MFS transporter [Pseudoalteromonas sp. OOF1S-7]MCG7535552.1 MFS transporter [Pseudoalteromonas sp. OOF1S-7]